ncbi:MAG: NAD(P)/FAD-dependent oxidoreductase [Bacteroidota bacterium]
MKQQYDVIIIGGSYSGLAAGMALGRALKQVLIIDSGKPCNAQTPHSHNFLTHDGKAPALIAALAKQQVENYNTVKFFNGVAIKGTKTNNGFEVQVASGELFYAGKLIFATGIRDMLPGISGIAECWGISVLHCPFCHGYEVKGEVTGVIGNDTAGYELAGLISNWTKNLTLFTNGCSTLSAEQTAKLEDHHIKIVAKEIEMLEHTNGYLQYIVFKDGTKAAVKAAYVRSPFRQVCQLPESLGCEMTEDGYIKVDAFQETSIRGVFACGDNTTKTRTVANAVATGTAAGMTVSKQLITEEF